MSVYLCHVSVYLKNKTTRKGKSFTKKRGKTGKTSRRVNGMWCGLGSKLMLERVKHPGNNEKEKTGKTKIRNQICLPLKKHRRNPEATMEALFNKMSNDRHKDLKKKLLVSA